MSSDDLDCPFRLNPRRIDATEVATCGLIGQLLRIDRNGVCDVPRAACEQCVGSTPVASTFVNTVFPSILSEACTKYLDDESLNDPRISQRASELIRISEASIISDLGSALRQQASCDVYILCNDASADTRRSIDSLLAQQNANVIIHLILNESSSRVLADDYASTWNVQAHIMGGYRTLFDAVQELVPAARSEFIALQHAGAAAFSDRIANAVGELVRTGSDLIGTAMQTTCGDVVPCEPTGIFQSAIPWPTLVIRRSTFIDLGGFASRDDADVELIYRAHRSNAKIEVIPGASVRVHGQWSPAPLGPVPDYVDRFGSLRHHAIGFPHVDVQFDVVIPVYGQLGYVAEAIEGIVEQEGAETIIHLIDDAGPENVDELFRYWGSHRNVRLYRNTENVGQYVSFNNVSQFFETEMVAVQDGDDISLPHRLWTAGNLLRLCDADYFAASMEQFGEDEQFSRLAIKDQIRRSFQPYGVHGVYFAMNPTACFRVAMFRRLGGYTDFGGREHNRAGLDSEFMNRAYYSQARFALSSSVVSRHRIHQNAATRNAETGFGSATRQLAMNECKRRIERFRSTTFDPRTFGAIGRYADVTQRVAR